MSKILIEAEGPKKWFPVQKGFIVNVMSRVQIDYVRAVDGVSFEIRRTARSR